MRSFFLVLALLCSLLAYADDVPPPPTDCPSGTVGDTGHEGEHCVPLDCSFDSDCKEGKVCKEFPLCIEEKMLAPGRSPTPHKYTFAYGACETGAVCKQSGATCTFGKRCVAPTEAASAKVAPKTSGTSKKGLFGFCSVSSPESGASSLWLFALLGLVMLRGVRGGALRSRR